MQTFKTQVKGLLGLISQPDAVTCQSTCIAMATGIDDVPDIRQQLINLGDPGNPYTMGQVIKRYRSNYEFDENASLSQMREWLKAGEFLITHGWFTGSGHVIGLDGVRIDPARLSYAFDVRDPWSEFDFKRWDYNNPAVDRFDGFYSSWGIYAACVAGQSRGDAAAIYRRGELDSEHKGAWVHRIMGDK